MRRWFFFLLCFSFLSVLIGCDSSENQSDTQQDVAPNTQQNATLDPGPGFGGPPGAAPDEDRGMPVLIYMVEQAENPDAADAFGCGDRLVEKTVYSKSGQDALAEVMRALVASENAGPTNYAAKGSVQFDSVSVDGTLLRVYLSGEIQVAGVCDHERIKEQFRATAMQFNGFDSVAVFVGKETLSEYLGEDA